MGCGHGRCRGCRPRRQAAERPRGACGAGPFRWSSDAPSSWRGARRGCAPCRAGRRVGGRVGRLGVVHGRGVGRGGGEARRDTPDGLRDASGRGRGRAGRVHRLRLVVGGSAGGDGRPRRCRVPVRLVRPAADGALRRHLRDAGGYRYIRRHLRSNRRDRHRVRPRDHAPFRCSGGGRGRPGTRCQSPRSSRSASARSWVPPQPSGWRCRGPSRTGCRSRSSSWSCT